MDRQLASGSKKLGLGPRAAARGVGVGLKNVVSSLLCGELQGSGLGLNGLKGISRFLRFWTVEF